MSKRNFQLFVFILLLEINFLWIKQFWELFSDKTLNTQSRPGHLNRERRHGRQGKSIFDSYRHHRGDCTIAFYVKDLETLTRLYPYGFLCHSIVLYFVYSTVEFIADQMNKLSNYMSSRFLVSCCAVHYDFWVIKMFGSSLLTFCFVGDIMFYLCYLYFFTHTGVQHDVYIRWGLCRLTVRQWVLLVDQELLIIHLKVFSRVHAAHFLLLYVVICISLFVPFPLFAWPLYY